MTEDHPIVETWRNKIADLAQEAINHARKHRLTNEEHVVFFNAIIGALDDLLFEEIDNRIERGEMFDRMVEDIAEISNSRSNIDIEGNPINTN